MAPTCTAKQVRSKDWIYTEEPLEDDFSPIFVHHTRESRTKDYLKSDDPFGMEEETENIFVEHEIHPIRCHERLTQASMPLSSRQVACNVASQCTAKKTARESPAPIQEEAIDLGTDSLSVQRPRHKKQRSISELPPAVEPHYLRSQFHPVYQAIQPGDVLFVKGSGALAGLAQLGATGGTFGHTILVTGAPTLIRRHSPDAYKFHAVWPDNGVSEIWTVTTLESARGHDGLLKSEILFRVDPVTGDFIIFGDVVDNDGTLELGAIDDDIFEVWQSPSSIRRLLTPELVDGIVADMNKCKSSWSLSTCVRAVFRTARIYDDDNRLQLFEDVCECWNSPPICTSVVIMFWQRCFCHLRTAPKQAAAVVDIDHWQDAAAGDALDLILRWMPLKADRGLPGELLQTMQQCGWIRNQKLNDSPRLSMQNLH